MHENGVIVVVFVEVKNEVDDDVDVDDYNAIIHDGMSENDEYLALDDNNDESSENDFDCDDVDDDRDNDVAASGAVDKARVTYDEILRIHKALYGEESIEVRSK